MDLLIIFSSFGLVTSQRTVANAVLIAASNGSLLSGTCTHIFQIQTIRDSQLTQAGIHWRKTSWADGGNLNSFSALDLPDLPRRYWLYYVPRFAYRAIAG